MEFPKDSLLLLRLQLSTKQVSSSSSFSSWKDSLHSHKSVYIWLSEMSPSRTMDPLEERLLCEISIRIQKKGRQDGSQLLEAREVSQNLLKSEQPSQSLGSDSDFFSFYK